MVSAHAHAAEQRELEKEPEPGAAILRGAGVHGREDGGLPVLVACIVRPIDDCGISVNGDDATGRVGGSVGL